MQVFGAFEAKNRLGHLLDLVEQGEDVVITRHGHEVARLVPPAPKHDKEAARAALARIRARAEQEGNAPLTLEEIRSLRDEGRR